MEPKKGKCPVRLSHHRGALGGSFRRRGGADRVQLSSHSTLSFSADGAFCCCFTDLAYFRPHACVCVSIASVQTQEGAGAAPMREGALRIGDGGWGIGPYETENSKNMDAGEKAR